MRLSLAPVGLALAFALGTSPAASAHGINFTVNFDHDQPILSCDDIEMVFGRGHDHEQGLLTVRRGQSLPLKLSGSSPLRVSAANRGGVRVQASKDGRASVLVCMAAAANTEAEANALLDRLRIRNEGGELTVTGPEDDEWAAYLILSVPRDATLDLEAQNGALALLGVSGRFTLRTTNGPISIADVAGKVDAEAVNGPIQFRGHSGDIRLEADNGPVEVKLDSQTWSGKGLDARTSNGPVQLSAPEGLRTGVLVEASGHSPIQARGVDVSHSGDWSGKQTLRLGKDPVLVRLSTVNGPVQINGPKASTKSSSKSKSKDVGI